MYKVLILPAVFLLWASAFLSTTAQTVENRIRINENLSLVIQDHKHRLIDAVGQSVLPGSYDFISVIEGTSAILSHDGKWAYIGSLDERPEFTYDYISCFEEGLAMVMQDDRWGYIDRSGKLVIDLQYGNTGHFNEGRAGVKDLKTGKYGYIDNSGKLAIAFRYDYAWNFHNGIARVVMEDRYGLIDRNGNLLFDTTYYKINKAYHGYYELFFDGKIGVVNRQGQQIIPAEYDFIAFRTDDDLFKIWEGERCGLVDSTGRQLTPVQYDYIGPFRDSIAIVSVEGKFGFLDWDGHEFVVPQYDAVSLFKDGLAAVQSGDKYGIVDRKGVCRVPPRYDHIRPAELTWIPLHWGTTPVWDEKYSSFCILDFDGIDLPEGQVVVVSDYDYAMLDPSGNQITPLEYDHFDYFTEGLALVGLNEKLGYIDTTGREVIPFRYDFGSAFTDGKARVKIDGRMGIIDKNNRQIIPLKYDNIYKIKYGMAITRQNGKFGLVDTAGNEIIAPVFDNIYDFNEGISVTRMGDQYGFIIAHPYREIAPKYDQAYNAYTSSGKSYNFDHDWKKVILADLTNFVDTLGVEMFPFRYTDIRAVQPLSSGRFIVTADGKRGLIQMDGLDTVSNNPNRPHGGNWTELIPAENKYINKITDTIYTALHGKKYRIWNVATGRYINTSYEYMGKLTNSQENTSLLRVRKNKKHGVIDLDGKIILPAIYKDVRCLQDTNLIMMSRESNTDWGLADPLGNMILPPVYDWIKKLDGYYLLRQHRKYGLADLDGNVVIPPIYEYLTQVDKNTLIAQYEHRKYGLITTSGEPVTEPVFREMNLQNGEIRFRDEHGKSGLIDRQGNILANALGNVTVTERGNLIEMEGQAYYLADDNGNISGPYSQSRQSHYASFRKQQTDQVMLPKPWYANTWNVENFVKFSDTEKYGILEPESGRFVSPMKYDYLSVQGHGAGMAVDGRHGAVSGFGEELIAPQYLNPVSFSEGVAVVMTDSLSGKGLIDYEGQETVKQHFDDAQPMKSGRIPVKVNDRWGAIDNEGNTVIAPQYDQLSTFEDGRAIFRVNGGNYGVVDRYGNIAIPPHYTTINREGQLFLCQTEDGYGFIDRDGTVLIEPKFDRVNLVILYDTEDVYRDHFSERREYLYVTQKDGKYGIVTPDGRETIEPKYDERPQGPRYNLTNHYSGHEKFLAVEYEYYFITREGREIDLTDYSSLTIEKDSETGLPFFIGRKDGHFYLIDFYGHVTLCPEDCILSQEWKNNLCRIEAREWYNGYFQGSGKYGYINNKGKIIVPPLYKRDDIKYHEQSQIFEVTRYDKFGLIHLDGTVIAETIYDEIPFPFVGGFAILKKGSGHVYVDRYGKIYSNYTELKKAYKARSAMEIRYEESTEDFE